MKSSEELQLRSLIFCVLAFLFLFFIVNCIAQAEPVYCSIDYFKAHELRTNAPHTKRLHSFGVGDLTLNGLAVGSSDLVEVAQFSPAPASLKHCTWYLNYTNDEAKRVFNYAHLPGPYLTWLWPIYTNKKMANDFENVLEPQLPEMLTCIEQYHYLAAGCDGQRHRGPSEFAWFLSVAGCDPKTSTNIANYFWSLNGVRYETRLAIANKGYQFGVEHKDVRGRLNKVMVK